MMADTSPECLAYMREHTGSPEAGLAAAATRRNGARFYSTLTGDP
jgi:hypothetical protein